MKKKLLFSVAMIMMLLSCGQKFKALEYRKLNNFKFDVFSLKKMAFNVNLVMYNPNSMGIDLLNSDMDIYINDKLLGKSRQNEAIRIDRISEFSIPLTVDIETGKLNLSFLKGMWDNMQKKKVKVTVKGTCRLRKMGVAFNFPVDYSDNVDLDIPSLF